MKFVTALHAAQNLGSAKSGVHHWIVQRVTALALIPLGLCFVYTFITLATAPYEEAYFWFVSSWTGTIAILFITFMYYHGYLGLKVILEDYISHLYLRWTLIIAVKLFSLFMVFLTIVSILSILLS